MSGSGPRHDADALVRAWLGRLRSPNTRAAYARDLALYVTWCHAHRRPVLGATHHDLEAFADALSDDGASAATVSRRMSSLSSFYRYAHALGRTRDPGPMVERPAAQASSATPEIDVATAAAVWSAALRLGSRTAALVGLVLHDGLKLNESLAVDVPDVRRIGSGLAVAVRRRDTTEVLALDPRTARVVRSAMAGRTSGPLLRGESPTRAPERLTRFGADYLIKRSGVAAGVPVPLTANILRRAHIAHGFARGRSIESLRAGAGHASTSTTLRYVERDATARR